MLGEYLPFWNRLTPQEQQQFIDNSREETLKKGRMIAGEHEECTGLLVIKKGYLRAYVISDEGKEITLFRLFDHDFCLFSASCMIKNLSFDVMIEAVEETEVYRIPANVYKHLMEESAVVANYTNELMASRFSDVMWLMDQVLNKHLDSRLAALLVEESELNGNTMLTITHEQLGNHLGSAREVVTRMLKVFQSESLIRLSRGKIEILDMEALKKTAADSMR